MAVMSLRSTMSPTIRVNDAGVEIAYSDSGKPESQDYITLFVIHGTGFSKEIFDKIAGLAPQHGLRWVSISRRGYPGSSPFSETELQIINSGSKEQKNSLLRRIGTDLAIFYDLFVRKHDIPIISKNRKSGGIGLLGWSSGCTFMLASAAQISSLPPDSKARMSSCVRALIFEDTACHMLGLPEVDPPEEWKEPFDDSTIPESERFSSFAQWVTGYFSHGDLATRSTDVLSYTDFKTSSISGIDPDIVNPNALSDRPLSMCGSELRTMLYNTVLNKSLRDILYPHMKTWIIAGEKTTPVCIACLWALEDLDKELGGGLIKGRIIEDVNHFMHWDYPELTIRVLSDCLYDNL